MISGISEHNFDKNARKKVKRAQEDLVASFMTGPTTERNQKRFRNAQNAITDKYNMILTDKLKDISKLREEDNKKMGLLKMKLGNMTDKKACQFNLTGFFLDVYMITYPAEMDRYRRYHVAHSVSYVVGV